MLDVTVFLKAAGVVRLDDPSELRALLEARWAAARTAWPGVEVHVDAYLKYLGERANRAELVSSVEALHTSDLYLACGCIQGLATALSAFDGRMLSQIPAYVSRITVDRSATDEITQVVREALLTPGASSASKLTAYSGRGALGAWLRITAVRTALNLKRREGALRHQFVETDAAGEVAQPGSQETRAVKLDSQKAFGAAFEAALQHCSADERTLLRLAYLDGLTVDQLSTLLKMPRSTTARHLAKCRARLLELTRDHLALVLRLPAEDVDSLINLAVSNLELSIARFLK